MLNAHEFPTINRTVSLEHPYLKNCKYIPLGHHCLHWNNSANDCVCGTGNYLCVAQLEQDPFDNTDNDKASFHGLLRIYQVIKVKTNWSGCLQQCQGYTNKSPVLAEVSFLLQSRYLQRWTLASNIPILDFEIFFCKWPTLILCTQVFEERPWNSNCWFSFPPNLPKDLPFR